MSLTQEFHTGDKLAAPIIKIVRMRNLNLSKTTINIDDITVPIFDRERTMIRAFEIDSCR